MGCPTDLQELISDDLDKLIGAEFRLKNQPWWTNGVA